jgi:hypothetical protein
MRRIKMMIKVKLQEKKEKTEFIQSQILTV